MAIYAAEFVEEQQADEEAAAVGGGPAEFQLVDVEEDALRRQQEGQADQQVAPVDGRFRRQRPPVERRDAADAVGHVSTGQRRPSHRPRARPLIVVAHRNRHLAVLKTSAMDLFNRKRPLLPSRHYGVIMTS